MVHSGRIWIDSNAIERLLWPIAIGRKNYVFFCRREGREDGRALNTVMQSARRNDVDVWPYLTDVLRRLQAVSSNDTVA